MTDRPVAAKRRQRRLATDLADEFDALAIHDNIHKAIVEDYQLARFCDAAAVAQTASECRRAALGPDAPFGEDLDSTEDTLQQTARQRARSCGQDLSHGL